MDETLLNGTWGSQPTVISLGLGVNYANPNMYFDEVTIWTTYDAHKFFINIIIILLCSVDVDAFTVDSGHPRILINSANISTLKDRAENENTDTYSAIKTWCDTYWNNGAVRKSMIGGDFKYDAGVIRYALIYALGEIPGYSYSTHSINDYGDMAVTIMLDIAAVKEPAHVGQEQRRELQGLREGAEPRRRASDEDHALALRGARVRDPCP